jgi:hypothetical protein
MDQNMFKELPQFQSETMPTETGRSRPTVILSTAAIICEVPYWDQFTLDFYIDDDRSRWSVIAAWSCTSTHPFRFARDQWAKSSRSDSRALGIPHSVMISGRNSISISSIWIYLLASKLNSRLRSWFGHSNIGCSRRQTYLFWNAGQSSQSYTCSET